MPLDIGVGIILSIIISRCFHQPLTLLFVIFGALFALAPDIDFIFHVHQGRSAKKFGHKHRDLLHYPILFILLGFLILLPFGLSYALLFAIAVLLHFIHDSIGIGWGIQWLYPFKTDYYAFLYHYEPAGKRLPRKIIHIWKSEEIDTISERHGDDDWFKNIYFRPHPYAIVEYLVFIIAVIVLLTALRR